MSDSDLKGKLEMNAAEKIEGYKLLNAQLSALLSTQNYTLSNLANASALLRDFLGAHTVFAGFYLFDGEKLILGPFQGSVSCVEIELGRGVCGAAAEKCEALVVDNVTTWKNYIACDSRAMSEIVVPLIKDERLVGVLDLDSDRVADYDEADLSGLTAFAKTLSALTDFKFFEVGKN